MTYTALVANQALVHLFVCSCCTICGEDTPLTSEPPVVCKTCGHLCSCSGCRAEQ